MRVTVRAEKMAAGGDAIARTADGKVLFAAGALPGEEVIVEVVRQRRDFAHGVVVDVLNASEARVSPPCPAVTRGCGGCAWQHIEPSAQMALKVDIATDALTRIGKLGDPRVRAGGAVPSWGYRTTLRLAVAPGGRLGLRAAGSHDVVVLDDCPVADRRLAELIGEVRATGDEVVLRVGIAGGERAAWGDGELIKVPGDVGVGRRAVVHERVGEALLQVSAGAFFQSGPAAGELLVEAVRLAAGETLGEPGVIDLYGGVGLFSAALGLAAPVVVESSSAACADARANLGDDARVECTTVERWRPRAAPMVIADPARAGLGVAGVRAVAATGAARVVLVSCDPASLGRDAALLVAAGYDHDETTVLDLFPHTPHLEAVSGFTAGGSPARPGRGGGRGRGPKPGRRRTGRPTSFGSAG
jgi:23S rRNA (uracil1939-C5)-methyltransferase